MEKIFGLMMLPILLAPFVLLDGFFMWFAVRRVTGEKCSYNRCCIATLISLLIRTAIGLFLRLVLPQPSEMEIIVATCIGIVVSWIVHMRILCWWMRVYAGQAFLVTLYQFLIWLALLGVLFAIESLWSIVQIMFT